MRTYGSSVSMFITTPAGTQPYSSSGSYKSIHAYCIELPLIGELAVPIEKDFVHIQPHQHFYRDFLALVFFISLWLFGQCPCWK